jgi:cation transport ATPase
MTAVLHLLARDSDFQASWYYSAVLFAGIVLVGWAAWMVFRQLRRMWRNGDRAMAVTMASATVVALLMFGSMLITVAIALLPLTQSGGAG